MKTANSKNIFGLGSAAIDFRIQTADFGKDYIDKLLAQKTELLGGGSVANFLVQVSRLGGHAKWLGKLGDDWIGREIIKSLKEDEVDISNVIIDKNNCSPFNVAVYAGEHRRRIGGFLLPNSLATLNKNDLDILSSQLSDGDLLLLEMGEIPFSQCLEFLERIKHLNIKIIIDVDLDPVAQCLETEQITKKIFSFADFLIPNMNAMKNLYGDINPEQMALKIAREFEKPTIVTAGAEGVYYSLDFLKVEHEPTIEVDVVDTVGAGDAFHGGFVYGIAENFSVLDAIKLGVKCGAFCCEKRGSRPGMPHRTDVRLNL